MAFCYFGGDDGKCVVEGRFIREFMPLLSGTAVKVYLFGLSLCGSLAPNGFETLRSALNLSSDEARAAFADLARFGVVSIVSQQPFGVRYNSLSGSGNELRNYDQGKFADFASGLQSLMPSVSFVNENQLLPYFDFLEESKMPEEALLMTVGYCVSLKGEKIHPNYVLTVARNWIDEGVFTADDVEKKIKSVEETDETLRAVAVAAGKRSKITLDDKLLYDKWTKTVGFTPKAILAAARSVKKGGFTKLDVLMEELSNANCYDEKSISDYAKGKQGLEDLAKELKETLHISYENYDYVVKKYVSVWKAHGFDDAALRKIADYCEKIRIRTFEGMNGAVNKFFKNGCVSASAIDTYIDWLVKRDDMIRAVYEACGVSDKSVTKDDRSTYDIWTRGWQFAHEVVLEAAAQSMGRPFPFANISRLLTSWRAQGVTTKEEAQKRRQAPAKAAATSTIAVGDANYSKQDLTAFFGDLYDTENFDI